MMVSDYTSKGQYIGLGEDPRRIAARKNREQMIDEAVTRICRDLLEDMRAQHRTYVSLGLPIQYGVRKEVIHLIRTEFRKIAEAS